MLSTADLQGMRDTLEASLPDSCAIVRDVKASDGAGGQTATPSPIATVDCRLAAASSAIRDAELVQAERIVSDAPWIVTLPALTDVAEADRITSGGRTLEVAAVLAPRSYEVGRRVLCREIK